MDNNKKQFHEIVAETLIRQLEEGTAPWQRPWNSGESSAFLPYNPVTDNRYKGINALYLLAQERADQRWMTYKQATDAGAQVRKGEKGTGIQYWKFVDEYIKKDASGKPLLDPDGKPIKEIVKLERPRVFFATVFNAEQIDGLPPLQRNPQTWDPVERAERVLAASGVAIHYNGKGRAFYRPLTDSIHLPDKSQFPNAENFYATALHELGHSTGHPDRLNRDLSHPFGSEGYAREELRAEIASMILGDELGIGHDPSQHAAYVGSWIKALKEDPMEIFRAAADAEKIQAYVLGLEQQQVQEHTPQPVLDDLSVVLAVGLETVLERPEEWGFDHFQDYEGASLEAALRHQGLNTVVDITGQVHDQFYETAIQRLSPVFGIDPEDGSISNAYFERKGLAQAFQLMAERLLQQHRQQQSDVEVKQITEETDMTAAQTMTLEPWVISISIIKDIERAKTGLAAWNDSGAQKTGEGAATFAMDRVQQGKYDEALEHLRTVANLEAIYSDQRHFHELTKTLEQAWRVWQQENGVGPAITPAMKRSFEAIPTDLSKLSSATTDDYQKAAELARIEEARVKRDSTSTAEDISAAREQRKTAELAATIHDSDFQKKVTEIELQQSQKNPQNNKTYIQVPYREKSEVKALGAKWDRGAQSWYIPEGVEQAPFSKWKPVDDSRLNSESTASKAVTDVVIVDRQYLAVPYNERRAAKAEGARWDTQAKSWYVLTTADRSKLQCWLPDQVKNQQAPAMMPREEFSEALHAVGCIVTGEHPIMDGKKHRIETVGDKPGARAGFYIAYLDGHPAGFIQNNRTGEVLKWKAKGYLFSEEDKAALQADQATKRQLRDLAQKAQQNRVASAIRQLLAVAPPAPVDHGYLQAKQVRPGDLHVVPQDGSALPDYSAVIIGKTWKESKALRESNPDKLVFTVGDLLLTAQDINGAIRSVQAIQENGIKRFVAGGTKQDMFHVVGGQGLDALEKAPAIVIGEGYATADTLSQALGYATVAAFDSGNLPNVAQQLREKFPDKPFVIAGDNDIHLALTEGKNPGKEKALAAAKAVDGTAIFPIFAPGEQMYPGNLEPLSPIKARSGSLTDEQQEAITKMKRYTDFNDLVTNSVLGREGLVHQVTGQVNNIIESQKKQLEVQLNQEQKLIVKLEQQYQRKAIKI